MINLIFLLMFYPTSSHTAFHFRTLQSNSNYNTTSKSSEKEITNYIYSLKYNPDEVLAYKGESVTKVKAEGHLDENRKFIVITRERKTIWNAKADIGVLISNEHRTYPGSLLLANYHLIDNSPDYLVIERAPIIYTVNLPGMGLDGSFTIVPTFANYEAAVNNILKTWFEKYGDTNSVNTLFQSDYSFAYSKEQLRVKFGLAFRYNVVELNTDFSAVDKKEKLIMIQRFQQIFYTVSVQSPYRPGKLFADGVTRAEVASKFNDKNPPVMVDSASYGRVIYVKIETTSTGKKAKALMETKLTNINLGPEAGVDYIKHLKNFNMQVFVMGGANDLIDLINANNLTVVNEVIAKHGKFSRYNIGYPISYSAEFIKDNERAVVKSTAEYTETTRTEHEKGEIKLEHTGWYVAQWQVYWDKVRYDANGNKLVTRHGWRRNGDYLTAPFSAEIQLDGNCENISVHAREVTGLFWDWWRTIIDRDGIPLVKERTFSIWGTTLKPKYSIYPKL